jgi:hypothetical protein
MAVPAPSTLSTVCGMIRDRLKSDAITVTIDTPAGVARAQQESTSNTILNLFFYRIEPSGFPANGGAHDRWYVRLRCLITAFSTSQPTADDDEASMIPEGEIDLRVLGEVLRYFNENPIIIPQAAEQDARAHVQVVLSPLSSEEINQIWSTQGDVAYRPSLLYEIAVVPIDPRTFAAPPLPVVAGGLRLHSHADMRAARRPPPAPPAVWISPFLESGAPPDWVPALSFVVGGVATQSIAIAAGPALTVPLWVAGVAGADVDLIWQRINRGVWETIPGVGTVSGVPVPAQPNPALQGVIDPAAAATAGTVNAAVPVSTAAQLLLFAQRNAVDGTVLRSNPLIVSITAPPP